MKELTSLNKGLEIIDPFLKHYDFELNGFEKGKSSEGGYLVGTYQNGPKKFIIDYRFSIGQILYQYDKAIVSHPYYIDQLGYEQEKKLTYFLSDDKPEAFEHILHDFKYLTEDFFEGKCIRLQEFAKHKDSIIYELDNTIRKENIKRLDIIRIEKAREEFRKKDFKRSMLLYDAIENKNMLEELDAKVIAFCKRHL
jgi:hypothetical protein